MYVTFRWCGPDDKVTLQHIRMIRGETGRPASGLCDRAIGAMYLQGLWEGVTSRG